MTTILKFTPVEMSSDMRLDSADILETAKSYDFERMAVIGRTTDGELYVAGTANAGETMILLEWVKNFIAFGRNGAE